MIVKNEEATLSRCLESAAGWVDEIVIVDTGSTDATLSIAKKCAAKTSTFTWVDDFSAARNASLEKATGDWILWLDADDVLPEDTAFRLRTMINSVNEHIGGIAMEYHTKDSLFDSNLLRAALFRNSPSIRFHGRVHEQLEFPNLQVLVTDCVINHLPQKQSKTEAAQKNEYYLTLLQKELTDNPNQPASLFHAAMTLRALDRPQEAASFAERFLELPANLAESHRAALCMIWLIKTYLADKQHDKAAVWVKKALELFPDHPYVLLTVGEYYLALQQSEEAERVLLDLAARRYTVLPDFCPPLITKYWRFQRLAEAQIACGKKEEARELLEEMNKRHPKQPETVRVLKTLTT